jgi:hypothetical protein
MFNSAENVLIQFVSKYGKMRNTAPLGPDGRGGVAVVDDDDDDGDNNNADKL